jgi:dienelactone hydrolase
VGACALTVALGAPLVASAGTTVPVDLPVLGAEVPAGGGTTVGLAKAVDPPRHVDGDLSDWQGRATRFGGSSVLSHGELVYQDHIFDAYGADDGRDAKRLSIQDPLAALLPETYRIDPTLQYVPQEFGIPTPPNLTYYTHYGDLPRTDEADLSEFRVGVDADSLWLAARTTTMTAAAPTALLVLLDTAPGSASRDVGFFSGLKTTRAEVAVLVTRAGGYVRDLASGAVTALPDGSVALNPDGYANAVEARVPLSALGSPPAQLGIAAAAGLSDAAGTLLRDLGTGPNVANVAFRSDEPSRDWWDKRQALELLTGTMDRFFTALDLDRLRKGANQRYLPGPGYHDRLFGSDAAISRESGLDGILQHYGVYIPTGYDPGKVTPLQLWMHFRGGTAHIGAAAVPRIFKHMGEDVHTIVVSPRGRGTSTWYVGKGQVDFREVWDDVHRSFAVDPNRTYVSGHSMGGWASYLLPILYPDRFAAALPASPPPTQGAWTGLDLGEQCDGYELDGESLCFTSANGGRPRDQLVTPLLENLRGVPLAIYQGVEDELVPVSGTVRQAQKLQELGYRYRLYLFLAQEHYGPPVQDEWRDGVAYEHGFVRDPNPPRVTYTRSMKFERAVEEINSDGVPLNFDFDRAFWMSGLQSVDPSSHEAAARFDGRSLAIGERGHTALPEAGGPVGLGQTGPYVMVGQRWALPTAAGAISNGFEATLTGAQAVTLDLDRMRVSPGQAVAGHVTSDHALELTLSSAHWPAGVDVTIAGHTTHLSPSGGKLTLSLPAGDVRVTISP